MLRSAILLTSTAAAFGLLVATADAAIHTVQSGQTIQSVIDQAAPGDLVQIPPGTYSENLLIDSTKTGLVLMGMADANQVIVDARPQAPTGSGPGLRIQASGVKVSQITIRHARSTTTLSGAGIDVTGANVELSDLVVLRSQNDGILAVADGLKATRVRLLGNGRGATVTGAKATFETCDVTQCGDRGISITGDDPVITLSKVASIEDGEAIVITGARASVRRNVIARAALDGIKITGADAIVEKNDVRSTTDKGIRISGTNAAVRSNFVADVLRGGDGIRIQNATSGVVEQNRVENCLENGIEVTSSSGVTISRNNVANCSSEKEASIQITSDTVVVDQNVVEGGQGDGIRVAGNGNTVSFNSIRSCLEDGIDLNSGTGNTCDSNRIERCLAEGIENNATGSTMINNVSTRSRLDYANNGTITTESNNYYVTGGNTSAPLIDD